MTGFVIMVDRSDDWGFQIEKMTESFPDHAIPGDMKLYYMLQASFWLHVRCCVDIQSSNWGQFEYVWSTDSYLSSV